MFVYWHDIRVVTVHNTNWMLAMVLLMDGRWDSTGGMAQLVCAVFVYT